MSVELGPLPEPFADDYFWLTPDGEQEVPLWDKSQMRAYAAQEVARERERCAKLADDLANKAWNSTQSSHWSDEFELLAQSIRRGITTDQQSTDQPPGSTPSASANPDAR